MRKFIDLLKEAIAEFDTSDNIKKPKGRRLINMILFRSTSKNNLYKAMSEKIWQCNSSMLQQLKVGDAAFIKVNGEEELHFLGLVESISREDILNWPDSQPDSLKINVPTIKFKTPDRYDFRTSQGNFNYDIYNEEK